MTGRGRAAGVVAAALGAVIVAVAAASPAAPEPEVRIAANGDITMGKTPTLPLDGGRSLFAAVSPYLEGDVVLGNLETTLTTADGEKCGAGSTSCFSFRAPPSYARWLKLAGYNVLNLANNHANDFGAEGERQTVAALDRFHLRHTGRPGEIALVDAGGVRVAIVGFAPYDWAQSLLDLPAARKLVRKAAARADVVVATMHAGGEGTDHAHVRPGPETYLGEPRGDPVAFAHAVIDAGADIVVGHGPHVLRGIEWYRGRLIAYSLGNFSSYRNLGLTGALSVSAVLDVTLRSDGSWVSGELHPVRLVGTGTPEPDPVHAAWDAVRSLSRADFGRRGVHVTARGVLLPPTAR